MKSYTKSIEELSQDPANARRHDNRNLEAITASLKRFGQQKPIVIDASGVVRAGNGTLAAAKSLGWETVEVVVTDLKGTEAAAYAIADNRTAELADWDYPELSNQLQSLMDSGIELPSIGWEAHEFEPLLQSDFDPRMTAYGGDGNRTEVVRPIKLTQEQRETIDKAILSVREREDSDSLAEGLCLEIICKEWLK